MLKYEEKITRFGQDKQFVRLSRPVRGRADGLCDACGSTRPRTLYGLTDVETGRHYFVGDSCLKELVKRGSILRRFGKQSGKQAYEDEMQLRAGPADHGSGPVDGQGNGSGVIGDIALETVHSGSSGPVPTGSGVIPSQILIVETQEHYQCFVALIHEDANRTAFGTACVPRYEEEWQAGGVFGLVLEKLKKERADAPIICVAKAWQEAYSQLTVATKAQEPPTDGLPGGQLENILLSAGSVLRPGAVPAVDGRHGP